MNRQDRLDLARWAVAQAQKMGAEDAAVNISNSRDIEIEYRDSKLEQLKESTQNSLNINLYVKNRYSGHSTNDIRKESLTRFIEKAVAMTGYLSEDPFRKLPDPKYYEGRKSIDLKVSDPYYEKIESAERVDIARAIEEACKKQSDKIISCTGSVGDTLTESVKVHSNGFEGERVSTIFYAGASATVDDGQGGRPEDWYYGVTRNYKALPDPATLGGEAAQRALAKIGQTKMESGKYDMIVENRSARRILGTLSGAMSGRSLQQRSSFLEGKLGQKIASENLTVIDDPFLPKGLGSRLYDGEGIATKKRVIIDKGVLKQYNIDTYYGRKLDMEPTSAGSTNILLNYGSRSQDEIIQTIEKGIFVTGFLGGNSNATTGDFSYGIGGFLVEGGKIVKPVNEMNISGNMLEFMNQLAEVGNDPYPFSSWRLPCLYFKDVEFSGI
ncbi:MAG: TldD/PmbA family protein [FCB group bacterium]|nr:TldD/PmbA family protein [FCB group bacterium]